MKTYTYICIKDHKCGLKKDQLFTIKKTNETEIIELTGHLFLDNKFTRVANKRMNINTIKSHLKIIS